MQGVDAMKHRFEIIGAVIIFVVMTATVIIAQFLDPEPAIMGFRASCLGGL